MKFTVALFALSIQGMRIMKRSFLEDFYVKNFLNDQVLKKARNEAIHQKNFKDSAGLVVYKKGYPIFLTANDPRN